jgi:hypothetical protein
MITSKGMAWIWSAENIIQNCVRAIEYASAVQGNSADQWKFTRNCYIESAIIYWWKIFGSCSESTNYTRFFGENNKLSTTTIPSLTSSDELIRLINSAGLNEDDYNEFHVVARKARNKFFAHFDLTKTVILPDIEKMKLVCLEMRDILKEVVKTEKLDASCDQEKQQMYTAISGLRNNTDLVSGFANGVKNFGKTHGK